MFSLSSFGRYMLIRNAMPKSTLTKLFFEGTSMRPGTLVVKSFDGHGRTVVGEVDLTMQIGSFVFQIAFKVMDISLAYNYLLGRLCIHAASAVTSTLHQKLKFIFKDKLIVVFGEEDMLVSHLSSFPYIKVDAEALETSFQALEIANVVIMGENDHVARTNSSLTSLKVKSSRWRKVTLKVGVN